MSDIPDDLSFTVPPDTQQHSINTPLRAQTKSFEDLLNQALREGDRVSSPPNDNKPKYTGFLRRGQGQQASSASLRKAERDASRSPGGSPEAKSPTDDVKPQASPAFLRGAEVDWDTKKLFDESELKEFEELEKDVQEASENKAAILSQLDSLSRSLRPTAVAAPSRSAANVQSDDDEPWEDDLEPSSGPTTLVASAARLSASRVRDPTVAAGSSVEARASKNLTPSAPPSGISQEGTSTSAKTHFQDDTGGASGGVDLPPTSVLVQQIHDAMREASKPTRTESTRRELKAQAQDKKVEKKVNDMLAEQARELAEATKKTETERRKLQQLQRQKEIETSQLRAERERLANDRERHIQEMDKLRTEEVAKLARQRKILERQKEDVSSRADRAHRDEVAKLKEQVAKLQEELKSRDTQRRVAQERLRRQVDDLKARNVELEEALRIADQRHVDRWGELERGKGRPSPVSDAAADGKPRPAVREQEALVEPAGGATIRGGHGSEKRHSLNQILAIAREQPENDGDAPTEKPMPEDEGVAASIVGGVSPMVAAERLARADLDRDHIADLADVEAEVEPEEFAASWGSRDKNDEYAVRSVEEVRSSGVGTPEPSEAEEDAAGVADEAEDEPEAGISPQDISTWQEEEPQPRGPEGPELAAGRRTERSEKTLPDGRRLIVFGNGTQKEIHPNGLTVVKFANGDVHQTFPDGKVTYFYADVETTHTTFPNGLEVYRFANNQIERHFPDGRKEITFPDGITKSVTTDGVERSVFPDRTVQTIWPNGRREVIFASGMTVKRIPMPGGERVEKHFPDGRVEVRKVNTG